MESGVRLQRGQRCGRYTIRKMLAAGAMAEVYIAYDTRLDLEVALKVLHLPRHADREEYLRRALREARTAAAIQHPNVLPILDVGAIDGRPFLAMNLVDGVTLERFVVQGAPWRKVLDVLRQAADALEAAHAAGLVHRDFKPDNVLVARDGHAYVTDFGLAHAGPPSERQSESVGTPAYMAPELDDGKPATARADQYSFAVAAFECLCGARPFPADDLALLRSQKRKGKPVSPWAGVLPTQVRLALERGMSPKPTDRFTSMAALREHLVPARRRTWFAASAGVTAGLAVAVAGGDYLGQWRAAQSQASTAAVSTATPQAPTTPRWLLDLRQAVVAGNAEAVLATSDPAALPADATASQRAEAALERGIHLSDPSAATSSLRQALALAAGAGESALAARAAAHLLRELGPHKEHESAGRALWAIANALAEEDAQAAAARIEFGGAWLLRQGFADEAVIVLADAAQRQRDMGGDRTRAADTLVLLAGAHEQLGRTSDAADAMERARRLLDDKDGQPPASAVAAVARTGVALSLLERGLDEDAGKLLEGACEALKETPRRDAFARCLAISARAASGSAQGQRIKQAREAMDPDDPRSVPVLLLLAEARGGSGDADAQAAATLARARLAPAHPWRLAASLEWGERLRRRGRARDALKLDREVLAAMPKGHPARAQAQAAVGRDLLRTGDATGAREALEDALAGWDASSGSRVQKARAIFALAQAQWADRERRHSARATADRAVRTCPSQDPQCAALRSTIERWTFTHR